MSERLLAFAGVIIVVGSALAMIGTFVLPSAPSGTSPFPEEEYVLVEQYIGSYAYEGGLVGTEYIGGGSAQGRGRGNYAFFFNASRNATVRIYAGDLPAGPGQRYECPVAVFEDGTYRFLGWDEPAGSILLGERANATSVRLPFQFTQPRSLCALWVDFGMPGPWNVTYALVSSDAWSIGWEPAWQRFFVARIILLWVGTGLAILGTALLLLALRRGRWRK